MFLTHTHTQRRTERTFGEEKTTLTYVLSPQTTVRVNLFSLVIKIKNIKRLYKYEGKSLLVHITSNRSSTHGMFLALVSTSCSRMMRGLLYLKEGEIRKKNIKKEKKHNERPLVPPHLLLLLLVHPLKLIHHLLLPHLNIESK